MSLLVVSRLRAGGVIPTYQCQSACPHCLYRGGPSRAAEYLDRETAGTLFAKALELGATAMHVGGGEPLADPLGLAGVLAAAAETGMPIEYVETSGSWYDDPDEARELLAELRDMGLSRLLVSISPMHNGFVPLRKTLGVLEAARLAGVAVLPWQEHFLDDLQVFDPDTTHPFREYLAKFGPDYPAAILGRTWIHQGGRAFDLFAPVLGRRPVEAILAAASPDCRAELTDTGHFHLDLYGDYVPGLCSGLALRAADLGAPLDPERYPILCTLAGSGIQGLFDYAAGLEGYTARAEGYVNKCELCQDIRQHLSCRGWFESTELAPAEFYATP
ncbi:Radical SAM domain protein [Solidesulfovibrio carbinoliphilus subsp. oakridgensis]|uniref:Radical SAM domain protein n=1 Tax=Solidesulfovibrio carbinoliphilus subsp. oakridgensis TaxID=694327 RepID=G7QAT2_9BACT|nr:radical SAM protein [Solidesulfovibrio carbinoliphilus]EHJ49313.1 Radical SAM domain protein [Solidesulfovibrio carbinoliphilus subsp. oakridgensis]